MEFRQNRVTGAATAADQLPTTVSFQVQYRMAGKFGGLAIYVTTAKLKSAKISYSHTCTYMYVWRSCTEPPNLHPLIFLQ